MRYAWFRRTIAAVFVLSGGICAAQNKINPATQIAWPTGCQVYNVATNSCPSAGGIVYMGPWSRTTTYLVNQAAFYSGATYVSLVNSNLNNVPSTSPSDWQPLFTGVGVTVQNAYSTLPTETYFNVANASATDGIFASDDPTHSATTLALRNGAYLDAANVFTQNQTMPTVNNAPISWFTGMGNANIGGSLPSATTGSNNTASGVYALSSNTTGSNNTASGTYALSSNTTGYFNTASGTDALSSNTTGSTNTASGVSALSLNTTGSNNTASGLGALLSNTTGSDNTASGENAGSYISGGTAGNTISSNSLYDGYLTEAMASGDTNENVIGNMAVGAGSNTTTIGNSSITKTVLQGTIFDGAAQIASTNLSDRSNLVREVPLAGTQTISQPSGTTLAINDLNNFYVASQYQTPSGTGNNGIANAIAQGCAAGTGCTVVADPGYATTEFPMSYWNGMDWPTNTSVWDYRAGTNSLFSHDPMSIVSEQGFRLVTNFDVSQYTMNTCCGGRDNGPGGFTNIFTEYTGSNNTQNTFGGIPMVGGYGAIRPGIFNSVTRYDSGQTFDEWQQLNCHGTGDCIGHFEQLFADGGINRVDDEGVHLADTSVEEDQVVFTGTISSAATTGATTVTVTCTIGCATQGQDRLLLDTNSAKTISGTFTTLATAPVNQFPAAITDANANYPVTTFVSLCYAGSDNGAGGAAGCPTNGTAPSGYIPPQATSPTQQAPNSPIVTSILPSYPNQPGYVCTNTTAQSGNSAAACYMPASGVGCLTDQQEYETVNYTYNSATQQVTLLNLTSSHLNGMSFGVGGLCGYAVEETRTIYHDGGTQGVQSVVLPVAGTPTSTSLLYIFQRVNEGLQPWLGADVQDDLLASASANVTLLADGTTVQLTITSSSTIGCYQSGLPVTITTANSTYNGTYPITATSCGAGGIATFTYTPSPAPSGTTPSTATLSYNNLQYTLYPAARTLSVYDAATKSVDGTFYLMPNTMLWAQNDPVRQAHYYPIVVTGSGNPSYVAHWTPEPEYGGTDAGITWDGIQRGGDDGGFALNNLTVSTHYREHGGTQTAPYGAYKVNGVYGTDFYIGNAPEQAVIEVTNCKVDIGCNGPLANFDLLKSNNAENANGGNGIPAINIDPANGGKILIGGGGGGQPDNQGVSLAPVEAGYWIADQNVTSPVAQVGGIATSAAMPTPGGPQTNVIGTVGSTTYSYYVVAHPVGGGTVLSNLGGENSPVFCGIGCGVTNGNATLSATNYNQVCAGGPNSPALYNPAVASWDILKLLGSTYYALATNVVVTATNMGCVNDQGQSLPTYVVPASNTTGQTTVNGPLNAATVNATASVTAPHIIATGNTVTLSGTGGTPTCVASTTCLDLRGRLSIPSATTSSVVTFATAFGTAPVCTVTQNGGATFFIPAWSSTTTALTITTGVALTAAEEFDYTCIQ